MFALEQAGSGTMDMQHYELRSLFEAHGHFLSLFLSICTSTVSTLPIFKHFRLLALFCMFLFFIHIQSIIIYSSACGGFGHFRFKVGIHIMRPSYVTWDAWDSFDAFHGYDTYDAYDLELDIPDMGISEIFDELVHLFWLETSRRSSEKGNQDNQYLCFLSHRSDRLQGHSSFFWFFVYEIIHVSTLFAPVACGNSELGAASCLWMWQWWGRAMAGQSRCVFT